MILYEVVIDMGNKIHAWLTSDGLSQAKVVDKLRAEKQREHLYFFKGNRQIARFEGEHNYVDPGNNAFLMRDCIVLHNHLQVTSFSREDVATIIENSAAELRLVAGNHTFVVKRPATGWGIVVFDKQGEYTDEFLASYNASYEYAGKIFDELVADLQMEERERDKYINHILWLDFFEKANIEYKSFSL